MKLPDMKLPDMKLPNVKLPAVRLPLPRTATGRALLGASAATATGIALGGTARALHSRSAGRIAHAIAGSADRSPVGAIARRAAGATSDLAAQWRGTDVRYAARTLARRTAESHDVGTLVAQAALVVLLAAAVAAGVRAFLLWRRTRAARTPHLAWRPATRATTRPATPVIALAAAGTPSAEIARRTGLSRDAIALALNVGARS